jgi:RNA polymerase sigma-70 factor (ECF subfamily)
VEEEQGSAADESAWWSAALAGDGDAFGRVFDLHHDRVYRHACRLVEVRPDAEDVTASAFLELWRRRDSVRLVGGSVLPWLLVTTGNLSRNVRRSTRRYRALLQKLPRTGTAADPAEVMLGRPVGWDSALVNHLREMTRTDLALITLVALEGFTTAEAADALGLSLAAAKSRLHRIRHRPGLPPTLTAERSHP